MDDPLIGKTLCGYRIERPLARGEETCLYLATQLSVARAVVLRVLSPRLTRDSDQVLTFLRRAREAGKLKHPGIVELHEVRQQEDFIFFSMEFLSGGSLARLLENRGGLPWRRLLPLLRRIISALAHAEEQMLVHASIEPDKLLVSAEGHLKILHPALARGESSPAPPLESLSLQALSCMAPERLRRGAADTPADMYALGCTIYTALCGRLPFGRGTREEILAAKRLHRVVPLRELQPDIPEQAAAVVERMMALSPEKRFGSFKELQAVWNKLLKDLELGGDGNRPGPRVAPRHSAPGRPPPRRHAMAFAVLALLAAGIVGGLLLLPRGGGPHAPPSSPPPAEHPPLAPEEAGRTARELQEFQTRYDAAMREAYNGRYREGLSQLDALAVRFPPHAAAIEKGRMEIIGLAQAEYQGVEKQCEAAVAIGQYDEALDTLREIGKRLPEALAAATRDRMSAVEKLRASKALEDARNAVRNDLARLDLARARQRVDALTRRLGASAGGSEREALSLLQQTVEEAEDLWRTLQAANLAEWDDLPQRFAAAFSAMRPPSLDAFRPTLLRSALELYRDRIRERDLTSLFRGAARVLPDGRTSITYDFTKESELKDFVPREDIHSSVAIRDAKLVLAGECRLLPGNPLQGGLELRMTVAGCDPDAPNVNVALWTRSGEGVAYSGRESAPHGEEARGEAPPGYAVFALGYRPVNPVVYSLKIRGAIQRVLFPCTAILPGARGHELHGDLRWECLWGENFLAKLKAPFDVDILLKPGAFAWKAGSRDLASKSGSGCAAVLQELVKGDPCGSVTLFTNGQEVLIDSLAVTGRLSDEWVDARMLERAARKLNRLVPGVAWSDV